MFLGEHAHAIDQKGRLQVPARFRQKLQGGVVITRGLDQSLVVYTRDEWQHMAQKLAALPISSKPSRAFARLMLAGAWDTELDSQGRIMIPEYLRGYASLTKRAIVAGLYNRIEIWDEDAWHTYRTETEKRSDDIAESMAELGI